MLPTMTPTFHTTSNVRKPAMPIPTLRNLLRRWRFCAAALEAAIRSNAAALSVRTSLIAHLSFQKRADFARQLDVARAAKGLRSDAWPRDVDFELPHDAARPRRHHDDAVAEEDRLVNRVGDQHHGLAARHPNALQLGVHALASERIERAERLVHQEKLGIARERAHDRGALLHSTRKFVRIFVLEAFQAGDVE